MDTLTGTLIAIIWVFTIAFTAIAASHFTKSSIERKFFAKLGEIKTGFDSSLNQLQNQTERALQEAQALNDDQLLPTIARATIADLTAEQSQILWAVDWVGNWISSAGRSPVQGQENGSGVGSGSGNQARTQSETS